MCQATRAEVVLVLASGRSVTPADRSYCDLLDTRDPAYNFINSSRPPKILESPLDSKSLSAGITTTSGKMEICYSHLSTT